MVWVPMAFACSFAAWAARHCLSANACEPGHLGIAWAEGFLLAIFGSTWLQAPLYEWWRYLVEGNMGMPAWLHRLAGYLELVLLMIRIGDGNGSTFAALSLHNLGPFGVQRPQGLVPALLVLVSSTFATDFWMRRPGS